MEHPRTPTDTAGTFRYHNRVARARTSSSLSPRSPGVVRVAAQAQAAAGLPSPPPLRARRLPPTAAGRAAHHRERRRARPLSAADRELGRPEADRLYSAVSYTRRARPNRRSARSRWSPPPRSSLDERLVSFSELKITESNFPTLQRDQLQTVVEEIAGVGAARRARDRARPRAGQHRHEPDHSEERRGREGRSADDLLQQDAGRARQHRRRSDLAPDPAERSAVRRQHELGSLPARADEDVLPAQRQTSG